MLNASCAQSYHAVLDVVELMRQVSGPRNELSRGKQPRIDTQRSSSYEALGRLQERNLFSIHHTYSLRTSKYND